MLAMRIQAQTGRDNDCSGSSPNSKMDVLWLYGVTLMSGYSCHVVGMMQEDAYSSLEASALHDTEAMFVGEWTSRE